MKSKVSRILEDLRAQLESIYGTSLRKSKCATRLDAVGQRNLAQCDASDARGAGFLSMNFFGPTSNEPVRCERKKGQKWALTV